MGRIVSLIRRSGYFLLLVVFISSGLTLFGFLNSNKIEDSKGDSKSNLKGKNGIFAMELPNELEFAGEKVPMENFDVRESLDQEILVNTYWHSRTILMIKRANRFFPMVEKILEKNGIPEDFKYLMVAESGMENAISPSGAVGFWQILKGTAQDYGLEVGGEVDERYNIEKSTEAACQYLNDSYKIYKNWALVAASYNMGRSALNNQLKRQKCDNYYDLLLNMETARYVFRILAYKLVLEDPAKYGFNFRLVDLYPEIETYDVVVNSSIEDFADFAHQHSTNYKLLKYFNPWLRDNYLSNKSGKKYVIKIPAKGSRVQMVSYTDSVQVKD